MINLKRKFFRLKQSVKEIGQPKIDPNVLIAEIHNSFDTAAEKLLNEAKSILSGSYDIEKGERLKNVGFVSAKKAVQAAEIISEKQTNKVLAETIEYYQFHYPNNKFITEAKVKEICQKYGLLCGETKFYISDVPEKNLAEIEAFELKQADMNKVEYGWYVYQSGNMFGYYLPCEKGTEKSYYGHPISQRGWGSSLERKQETETHHFESEGFKICASVKDFNTKDMRIEDGYMLNENLPDPIVLQPVKGGYLVVSKWGIEGEDADLTNEKLN